MPFEKAPPLSLYIHIPWCIKKCPYCDFNSHVSNSELPEKTYIQTLIEDLENHLPEIWGRPIVSIFIGGGTPSLFHAEFIDSLLMQIAARSPYLHPNIEITMEANPGTFEQQRFKDFKLAGINRLSLGIQSFQDEKLKTLGRIHSSAESRHAITGAQLAGFERINVDLMHGLPKQSANDALFDLQTAIDFNTAHISWYQLTLEPNTVFGKYPPPLPQDETLWNIQEQGQALLSKNGFQQYEISAYCKDDQISFHNMNYWQFGDYLGLGAGAHSKITDVNSQTISRFQKKRIPKDYLNDCSAIKRIPIKTTELALEFMMNALRLKDGIAIETFLARTGLDLTALLPALSQAYKKDLMLESSTHLQATTTGQMFLNDLLQLFMTV